MAFIIDAREARAVVSASKASWTRWTTHLPHDRHHHGRWGGGGSTPKKFRFDDLVVALRVKSRVGLAGRELATIMDLVPNDTAEALDDAEGRVSGLLCTLTAEERERFERVRKWAAQGATFSMWQQTHLIDLPRHLDSLILRSATADYVFTARRRDSFPTTRDQWGDYIAAHVHANATPKELNQLAEREING